MKKTCMSEWDQNLCLLSDIRLTNRYCGMEVGGGMSFFLFLKFAILRNI